MAEPETRPAVSVVVLARGDDPCPDRCLRALSLQVGVEFEVVVAGSGGVRPATSREDVKLVVADGGEADACNQGISATAGEIVAILDSDASPEPGWLAALLRPFDSTAVDMTIGFSLASDGRQPDLRALSWDAASGIGTVVCDVHGDVLLDPPAGHIIAPRGLWFAARRDVLARMGGFDPVLVSDAALIDLALRVARGGGGVALCPQALVLADWRARLEPDFILAEGAAFGAFLRRHVRHDMQASARKRMRNSVRLRLIRAMQEGLIGPDEVLSRLWALDRGMRRGLGTILLGLPSLPRAAQGYQPFSRSAEGETVPLCGSGWASRALVTEAGRISTEGGRISVHLFWPFPSARTRRFTDEGIWLSTGGYRFGRRWRDIKWSRSAAIAREIATISPRQGLYVASIPCYPITKELNELDRTVV